MSFLIDGNNTLGKWGVDIGEGANENFLSDVGYKDRFSHNWGDENGTEYWDEEVLYKKSQNHVLQCVIAHQVSKQVAVQKYKVFLEYIKASGGFDLQSDVVIDPVHLYYVSATVTGVGNSWITFSVQLIDVKSQASEYGYLTTDTGIYITDDSSNKIIVKANI